MAGGGLALVALAIPVYALAPDALRYFVTFHRVRGPSRGSIWYYLAREPATTLGIRREDMINAVNIITATLVVTAVVVLVTYTVHGRLSPIAACALATTAFVVTNKIYSPQYDLWLVPFLVMLPVRTKLVMHFYVSSFLVFVLIATESHVVGRPLSLYILAAGVLYRLAVHVLLAREFCDQRLVGECPKARTPRPNGGRMASKGFSLR